MATMPGFRKSLQCPGCANTTLAEFYEPAGAALCPRCGLVFFYDSLRRLEAVQAKRDAEFDALRERLQTLKDTSADSLDFIELAMELEEFGVTRENLKAANVETLEDLKHFIELLADQHPINRDLGDQEK
jgi:acyl carrier protein